MVIADDLAPLRVPIGRWQEYTGAKPVLEATGEPHDFTEERDDDAAESA